MHDIELFALLLYLFELPQNKMHYFCIYLNLVAILPQFRPGKKSNHSTVVVCTYFYVCKFLMQDFFLTANFLVKLGYRIFKGPEVTLRELYWCND